MSNVATALQSAAGTILSVLAPATSRLARVTVRFQQDADSASTDGNLVIRMPRAFAGAAIPGDAPVTLGLLAHELGHWVQPLDAVTEIAQSRGAPHWLANIAMDIHGESFVQALFPALRGPLKASRQAVRQTMLNQYRRDLAEAVARRDFPDMALHAALIARFGWPDHPWTAPPRRELRAPDRVHAFLRAMERFLALNAPPDDLPQRFARLLDDFPELTRGASSREQEARSRKRRETGVRRRKTRRMITGMTARLLQQGMLTIAMKAAAPRVTRLMTHRMATAVPPTTPMMATHPVSLDWARGRAMRPMTGYPHTPTATPTTWAASSARRCRPRPAATRPNTMTRSAPSP